MKREETFIEVDIDKGESPLKREHELKANRWSIKYSLHQESTNRVIICAVKDHSAPSKTQTKAIESAAQSV